MAVNVKFDLVGNPEPPTIILAKRNGDKLGQLYVNAESIELSDRFNDVSEISFTLNKYIDNKPTPLWDKVVDFKLVYCQEWDLWFEIKVELDETTETVKTVFCTQLGQAELSQINLYDIHINEEGDLNWNTENKEYKSTILYDPNNTDVSLLHRLLKDKAPHYSILYVDDTIKNIQRSFSFDCTSIHDAFKEIAEEIGCLFVYNSNSDENGKIQRTISVYDLWQNCLNPNCKHRGEFTDKCPKCGGTNIDYNEDVFEDTRIFVTSDELATEGIQLTTDTDSVKNCFKLEAGDDLMTATVRNCNPNGTDYIWHFSENIKEDMSDELVDRINSYDELYKEYYGNYESKLDASLVDKYNTLVEKYKGYYNTESTCLSCNNKAVFEGDCPKCGSKNVLYGKYLHSISATVKGYSSLMNAYYNVIDFGLYLESGLMPTVPMSDTKATEQIKLLTSSSLSPVAVNTKNIESVSVETANSAVLSMAKVLVKSTYKVDVNSSSYDKSTKKWTGSFIVTNYSDENDTATSSSITVTINNKEEDFIKQKIDKALNKEDAEDLSISGLFEKELKVTVSGGKTTYSGAFYDELKKYGLSSLKRFYDACDACLNVLIDQGVSESNNTELYKNLYTPYRNKSSAITEEIKLRESEIAIIKGVWDESIKEYKPKGLRQIIEECRNVIQKKLNFESHLGEELWKEFCSYRRDDTYSNDNYISEGLDNAKLFEKALEFYEVAKNEIYKAAELQHSISTSLNNLLAIDKFKSLVESFKVGNWIRVQVDDRIFKLRLLEYNINFGSFENISVEFSDVTKLKNGVTDVKKVIDQASSMATNYSSVQRQAKQGEKSNSTLNNWVENGLSTTQAKIVDSVDENLMFGKNAFWCRQYDPITKTYSDEQIKIINSTIAITDDNWNTTKTAIGKFYYEDPLSGETKVAYGVNGETIVGKLLIGKDLIISNDGNNLEFSADGFVVEGVNNEKNIRNRVTIDPTADSIFNIINIKTNNDEEIEKAILSLNDEGELVIGGNLNLADGTKIESGSVKGLSTVAVTGKYQDLVDEPTKLSDFTNDTEFITKSVSNLSNYHNKSTIDASLDLKADKSSLSTVATSGSYNDLKNLPLNNKVIEEVLYTEFEQLKGWYDKKGSIGQTSNRAHSQLLPINESTDYYLGYTHDPNGGTDYECTGAFFDMSGKYISSLLTKDVTTYDYKVANGNTNDNSSDTKTYVKLYKFKSPAKAAYFSYNLAIGDDKAYRQFVSSKPIFMLSNTGNYIIYEGDPIYQAKKNKKLCVIGASGVAIDRQEQSEMDNQHIVGFQEYLSLWYDVVDSYGFSSGGWGKYDAAENTTIYDGIISKKIDLSSYDEFLLIPSTANIGTTGIGAITDSVDADAEKSTYMAGLNAVIDYIYTQVPLAKIYLTNAVHKGKYFTDGDNNKKNVDEINAKLAELSVYNSYQLIDLTSGSGINKNTYTKLTYDKLHLNHEGNKLQGLFIRKEIIGI